MDKKVVNTIISKLRTISMWSEERKMVRNRCKVKGKVGKFKNGKDKIRLLGYKCEHCSDIVDKIDVDHVIEIGSFSGDWNDYIARLFCSLDNLQGLCKKCHKQKTKEYKSGQISGDFYL